MESADASRDACELPSCRCYFLLVVAHALVNLISDEAMAMTERPLKSLFF